MYLVGVEWARAVNLTYAPGPALLASHWRPVEPALFGRGRIGQQHSGPYRQCEVGTGWEALAAMERVF